MPALIQSLFIRTLIPGLAALCLAGCIGTPTARSPAVGTNGRVGHYQVGNRISTGRILTKLEVKHLLPQAFIGDESYAEVNSLRLFSYYHEFRSEIFRLGVTKWDSRFDCNRFAELYSGIAQTIYLRESFHTQNAAGALAIGPYWYRRANGLGYHAIVQILTEQGLVFVDPQTGVIVQLTPAEKASAYLQVI